MPNLDANHVKKLVDALTNTGGDLGPNSPAVAAAKKVIQEQGLQAKNIIVWHGKHYAVIIDEDVPHP